MRITASKRRSVNARSCAPPELARSIEHARIPADPKSERARADRLNQHESPGGRSGCLGVASSQEARGCCSAGAEPWTCDGRPAREVGGMQVAQPGAVARGPRTAHAPRQARAQRAALSPPPIRMQIGDPVGGALVYKPAVSPVTEGSGSGRARCRGGGHTPPTPTHTCAAARALGSPALRGARTPCAHPSRRTPRARA